MTESLHPCPCCGYLVFRGLPGSFEVCPVCWWEDDGQQLADPTYPGGANGPSLQIAQSNFEEIGACEDQFVRKVRSPLPSDQRDLKWRPWTELDGKTSVRAAESGAYYWLSGQRVKG